MPPLVIQILLALKVAAFIWPDYPSSPMKKLATVLLIPALIGVLSGCASGPSPEQQTREVQQQIDAERQQAEFRKGLPPVSNPGQGW